MEKSAPRDCPDIDEAPGTDTELDVIDTAERTDVRGMPCVWVLEEANSDTGEESVKMIEPEDLKLDRLDAKVTEIEAEGPGPSDWSLTVALEVIDGEVPSDDCSAELKELLDNRTDDDRLDLIEDCGLLLEETPEAGSEADAWVNPENVDCTEIREAGNTAFPETDTEA